MLTLPLIAFLVRCMAAITDGQGYLAAGDSPNDYDIFLSGDLTTLDNAAGNSDTPYLDSRTARQKRNRAPITEKPDDQGVPVDAPIRYPRHGAHRGPGELYYFLVEPNSNDYSLDTSAFSIHLKEQVVNVLTGRRRNEVWNIGKRETDTGAGGISDDKTITQGRKTPSVAIPSLGPAEYGKGYGRFRLAPDGTTV